MRPAQCNGARRVVLLCRNHRGAGAVRPQHDDSGGGLHGDSPAPGGPHRVGAAAAPDGDRTACPDPPELLTLDPDRGVPGVATPAPAAFVLTLLVARRRHA